MLGVLYHSKKSGKGGSIEIPSKGGSIDIKLLDLASEMLLMAGFFIFNFKISLGRQDKLLAILTRFLEDTKTSETTFVKRSDREQLRRELKQWLLENKKAKDAVLKYVPYRFLTPFFANELARLRDNKKNSAIIDLACKYFDSRKPLYKIDIKKECIVIHSDWSRYLNENVGILEGWVGWELGQYFQSRNPSLPAIPLKIQAWFKGGRAGMQMQREYWQRILQEMKGRKCFYSDGKLDNFSLDHFLPWSYVGHNRLWNLIPVLKEVNSSKGNKLPDMNQYLGRFIRKQHFGIVTSKELFTERRWENFMEPFIDDFKLSDYGKLLDKKVLDEAYRSAMLPQAQIAENYGFTPGWRV